MICDGGHEAQEVRRLPLAPWLSGAGVFVCREHYDKECAEQRRLKITPPAWETLPLQEE